MEATADTSTKRRAIETYHAITRALENKGHLRNRVKTCNEIINASYVQWHGTCRPNDYDSFHLRTVEVWLSHGVRLWAPVDDFGAIKSISLEYNLTPNSFYSKWEVIGHEDIFAYDEETLFEFMAYIYEPV